MAETEAEIDEYLEQADVLGAKICQQFIGYDRRLIGYVLAEVVTFFIREDAQPGNERELFEVWTKIARGLFDAMEKKTVN